MTAKASSLARKPADTSDGHPVYLGCSGWAYPTWKPGFYPAATPTQQFLRYYASQLNSVEVNYTFRKLPEPATVEAWLEAAGIRAEHEKSPAESGASFRFSFKAPQAITHFKRLRDCADDLKLFSAMLAPVVGAGCMGVVLFQLPPNFKADREGLSFFLKQARKLKVDLAFEFRNETWFREEIFITLREHNAALCVAMSDDLRTPDVQTADFACYRLRQSKYALKALKQVAQMLKNRALAGDVYAYFKHEEEPDGALRARKVLRMVRAS